uniref:Ribosomal RNA small subunit methyltransferase NEP1 n=1 Tax=Fagus sylvatica TaxID=28930 RepID=A0A2N9I0Y4_FAGSY
MARPYAVQGKKRKRKEARYDQQVPVETQTEKTSNGEEEEEVVNGHELEGIPVSPTEQNAANEARVTFILENASLEVAKVGKSYQLLNFEDHENFLSRNNRNPNDYRPDIVYQALLMIMDSRINKSGGLRAVYLRTKKGVLIEVKPHARLPRTFKRFSGLMLQLLQNQSVKRDSLLRVIKYPISRYLPVNSRKIGFSFSSEKLVNINKFVASTSSDVDLVFVVGAMADGKIDKEYADEFISKMEDLGGFCSC